VPAALVAQIVARAFSRSQLNGARSRQASVGRSAKAFALIRRLVLRPSGVCIAILGSAIVLAAMQDKFPDGPGKAEVLKTCGGCHDAEIVLANLKTPGEWGETLQNMAQQGAEATPAEWGLIEKYLDLNFALIAINKAPAEELQLTMDVSREVADAVVTYRRDNGSFKSVDDVKKVAGIDAAKVDARKSRFVF
jgi:competence protein ComEA